MADIESLQSFVVFQSQCQLVGSVLVQRVSGGVEFLEGGVVGDGLKDLTELCRRDTTEGQNVETGERGVVLFEALHPRVDVVCVTATPGHVRYAVDLKVVGDKSRLERPLSSSREAIETQAKRNRKTLTCLESNDKCHKGEEGCRMECKDRLAYPVDENLTFDQVAFFSGVSFFFFFNPRGSGASQGVKLVRKRAPVHALLMDCGTLLLGS